jgi:hypothetical protein
VSASSALEGTVLNVLIPLIGIYGRATIRVMMLNLQTVQQIGWGASIFLRAFLLCLLIFRKNMRFFPFFTAYLIINIGKGVALNFAYKAWGFESLPTYKFAWIMAAMVTCVKALAVAELCRLLLGGYRGIWSLAWRVLLTCAGLILLYSAFAAKRNWEGAIIGAGRASELAIATVIVIVFLFMRHYEVVSEASVRFLALGFCIYSCMAVINFTILERYTTYSTVWNALNVGAYLASLFVWTWALHSSIPRAIFHPMLFSRAVYQQLSPEINARLRALNDQLITFGGLEAPRS